MLGAAVDETLSILWLSTSCPCHFRNISSLHKQLRRRFMLKVITKLVATVFFPTVLPLGSSCIWNGVIQFGPWLSHLLAPTYTKHLVPTCHESKSYSRPFQASRWVSFVQKWLQRLMICCKRLSSYKLKLRVVFGAQLGELFRMNPSKPLLGTRKSASEWPIWNQFTFVFRYANSSNSMYFIVHFNWNLHSNCYKSYVYCICISHSCSDVVDCPPMPSCFVALSIKKTIAQFRGVWRYWLVSIAKKQRKPWALPRSCVTWLRWYVCGWNDDHFSRFLQKKSKQTLWTSVCNRHQITTLHPVKWCPLQTAHFMFIFVQAQVSIVHLFWLCSLHASESRSDVLVRHGCVHMETASGDDCNASSFQKRLTQEMRQMSLLHSFADFDIRRGDDRHSEYHALWLWIARWLRHSFYL